MGTGPKGLKDIHPLPKYVKPLFCEWIYEKGLLHTVCERYIATGQNSCTSDVSGRSGLFHKSSLCYQPNIFWPSFKPIYYLYTCMKLKRRQNSLRQPPCATYTDLPKITVKYTNSVVARSILLLLLAIPTAAALVYSL